MNQIIRLLVISALAGLLMSIISCKPTEKTETTATNETSSETVADAPKPPQSSDRNPRFNIYTQVELSTDLSKLTSNQKQMIPLLIDAARIMDQLFWQQATGRKLPFLKSIDDRATRHFATLNYGPWDRLDGNKPFIEGFGPKPAGATFYPKDMTKEEFDAWEQPGKDGLYSYVERNPKGKLKLVPYSKKFAKPLERAAQLLRQASKLAEDKEFANYLNLRADALVTDNYQPSDMAWMDMKNNQIELVIGPIESYEDQLYGSRASFEAYVLIKDMAWSKKLARFAQYLPELQKGLPVDDKYKQETPGSDSDLNAYDAIFYAGDCNAGSKTIAINLPNDEEVQLAKGTRRLQLKNTMRAKFDKILIPIADLLIANNQRTHITFDAFFANTMFHEVAHGLGIKNVLDGNTTVRQAMQEHASALEEGKADILGLYMIQELRKKGEISEGELMDNYVTFMASIFRSIRFGASSAHGRANMIRFNYFSDMGAFSRDEASGKYQVNIENFEKAVKSLTSTLLKLQGDGDYAGATKLVADMGSIKPVLASDLERLADARIPVDIFFKQGLKVLGLEPTIIAKK
ncbi:MAG: Zn-dependent hydrolase [Proteobacteria bacterium]|nr:Zn-dependent hydrolase [Pseudomonadota bacterium]